ncbi:abortive infection protein [Pseudomonas sp. FW300-N1A1]|uniref:AAA family ATPase n=1 Tax=Pseudomonas sp. FW300-N1A1 TaxID=2075555 RepID=UPI000CD135CF|nr:ATP-binding protein [Pseudomonas sp. FW300-N1A1]POA19877.1 abortive infection protein [Pseudomonas sp. FW300-N1A1]
MIYSFGANNYFSFKDGFQVSLEFNSKVPKSISNSRKVSTILGIKGGNASGKTNILKCLQFLSYFVARSFNQPPEGPLFLNPFFTSKKPTDIYIDFESNGIRYIYELSATKTKVIREAIYKKISRKTLIIERKNDELKSRVAELSDLDLITLRSNASLVDTALQYNMKGLGQDLHNIKSFFHKFKGNVSSLGVMEDSYVYDYNVISEYYYKNNDALEFAKNIIKSCDLGISDVEIFETENEKGEPRYFPMFLHPFELNGSKSEKLTYWDESDGTTALYRRLYQYWTVLTSGGALIMDEFDTNYHPALLPQILDLFINKETNPKNAQFIFTSHNLEIMDYLGKYRTYLVSKESGESFCYRLDEIPGDIIRNDRSISGLYRDGKLGGIPNL